METISPSVPPFHFILSEKVIFSLVCTSQKILKIYLKTQVEISDIPVSKNCLDFQNRMQSLRMLYNQLFLIIISVRISFYALNPFCLINYSASPPALCCCVDFLPLDSLTFPLNFIYIGHVSRNQVNTACLRLSSLYWFLSLSLIIY